MPHYGVTIATVPEEIKANLQVRVNYQILFKVEISSFILKDKVMLISIRLGDMTHHGVTTATVPEEIKANLELRFNCKIPFNVGISSIRHKGKVRLSFLT